MSLSMRARAESLLERLLRDRSTSRRVADLLWAIRGDLDNPRLGTEALLDELAQEARDGDWGLLENTDGIGPVEVTAHVNVSDIDDSATGTSKRRLSVPLPSGREYRRVQSRVRTRSPCHRLWWLMGLTSMGSR